MNVQVQCTPDKRKEIKPIATAVDNAGGDCGLCVVKWIAE